MPKRYPEEFRRKVLDLVAAGRQITKEFGSSEACLRRWLKIADREVGRAARGDSCALYTRKLPQPTSRSTHSMNSRPT